MARIRTPEYLEKQRISHLGQKAWNKGLHHSTITRKKISRATQGRIAWNKGKTNKELYGEEKAEIMKLHASISRLGNHWKLSDKTKRKMRKPKSEQHCKNMSKEKNHNWLGGKSFEPYGIEFDNRLRELVRKRDNYRCQECFRQQDELYLSNGKKYKLSVHHIDYDKKNNQQNNLISLCKVCHLQTNYSRNDWIKYFQNRAGG